MRQKKNGLMKPKPPQKKPGQEMHGLTLNPASQKGVGHQEGAERNRHSRQTCKFNEIAIFAWEIPIYPPGWPRRGHRAPRHAAGFFGGVVLFWRWHVGPPLPLHRGQGGSTAQPNLPKWGPPAEIFMRFAWPTWALAVHKCALLLRAW